MSLSGALVVALSWVDPEKAVNIDKWGSTDSWLEDIPCADSPAEVLSGEMTSNAPIDVISWSIDGHLGEIGLEWWQMGLSLLLRHI